MNKNLTRSVFALALIVSACGSSGDDSTEATAPEVTTADAETSADAGTASTADAGAASTAEATEVEPDQASVSAWTGGNASELLDTRMDELAAVFGQPVSASAVAPIFEIADDFPLPEGAITGVFHEYDRDRRVADEIAIDEDRVIGIDGDPSAEALDAIAAQVGEGSASRWARSSAQRQEGQAFNDLFTADSLTEEGVTERVVLNGNPDYEEGEPVVFARFESHPTELPTPDWAAGLPMLEGGELDSLREGRGEVSVFGGHLGYDGSVEIRWFYPAERYEELGEYLSSGVITEAGFTDEGTTNSNLSFRTNVSLDGWEGTVAVGEVVINDELIGHHLFWALTRQG